MADKLLPVPTEAPPNLAEYVLRSTSRGTCRCLSCATTLRFTNPDPPHAVDVVFFKVGLRGVPTLRGLRRAVEHQVLIDGSCDPLDGEEHSYLELGTWLRDQGVALRLMGLGTRLGLFELATPRDVLGPGADEALVNLLAGRGFVTVRRR